MLNVRHDSTRKEEEGQYFVELIKNRGLDPTATDFNCFDRLGYWCDKPHLKHMILALVSQFSNFELFYDLFEDKTQTNDKVNELKSELIKNQVQIDYQTKFIMQMGGKMSEMAKEITAL